MSNFWRLTDLLLIECEIGLHLKWKKNFVISEVSRTFRGVDPNANPVVCPVETETTGAIFQLTMLNFMFQLLLCLSMIISNF